MNHIMQESQHFQGLQQELRQVTGPGQLAMTLNPARLTLNPHLHPLILSGAAAGAAASDGAGWVAHCH